VRPGRARTRVSPGEQVAWGLGDGWKPEPDEEGRCPGPRPRRACRLPRIIPEHMFVSSPVAVSRMVGAMLCGSSVRFAALEV
jgi:hypothetical protein